MEGPRQQGLRFRAREHWPGVRHELFEPDQPRPVRRRIPGHHGLEPRIAETFNDPLVSFDGVHNITPWWLAPNGLCQNNLEVGDVIEGLPNGVYPITMPNGFTYHPQNGALLQWFAFESPSSAISGAYSYPNTSTLTSLSAPQGVNCQ